MTESPKDSPNDAPKDSTSPSGTPLRFVTIITRLIRGGAQRLALEITVFLREKGVDARLWCGPETGPEGSLHEEAAARGVPVRIFPNLVRAVSPHQDLRIVDDLARALREEAPAWVHTHSSKAGIVGRFAARRAGLPRVAHTVHGWGFTPETPPWMRRVYIALERSAARRSDRILFVNPGDRLEGERLGILPPGAGLDVLPGIDLAPFSDLARLREDRIEVRRRLNLTDDDLVAGFLGRLSPQKDPGMAIEVALRLRSVQPRLRWLIVGDGPLRTELEERCRREDLTPLVRFAGLARDPAPWLAAMDFLVLPSRWEGTPLTVMEAMAAGLPVVASDLPGTRALIEGTPSLPLLARAGAVEEFVERVRMAAGSFVNAEVKERTREAAFARFSLQRMLREVWGAYGFDEEGTADRGASATPRDRL